MPGSFGGFSISTEADGTCSLTIRLQQGASTVATRTINPVTNAQTDYDLTSDEYAAITDRADLHLELEAS